MGLYEQAKLIINYLRENKEAFNELERDTIISNIGLQDRDSSIPSVVLQLYDELGILPDDKNIYKAFLGLLDEEFNIKDKNIIEIGGGNLPRLGIRIANMQNKGTITVYDPKLYKENIEISNLKLIKRKFNTTNVGNSDILIGLMPCGATSRIINSAIEYNKDFMIALCDHLNTENQFDPCEEDIEWKEKLIESIIPKLEENNMGKVKIKYLKEIGNNPIIYNDRG